MYLNSLGPNSETNVSTSEIVHNTSSAQNLLCSESISVEGSMAVQGVVDISQGKIV